MSSILAQSDVAETAVFDQMTAELEKRFSSIDDVRAVAHAFNLSLSPVQGQRFSGRKGCADISEGRVFTASITPGTFALSVTDPNRIEKAVAAAYDKHLSDVDALISEITGVSDSDSRWYDVYEKSSRYDFVGWDNGVVVTVLDRETGELISAPAVVRQEIREWSKKSRMRMVRAIAELDYSGWGKPGEVLAMVTLTLPGKWEDVAPTGKVFKKLFKSFEARVRRALGGFKTLWKLEFQTRGAAHIHMLMRIPAFVGEVKFEDWLSQSWADVVNASKEIDGLDASGNPSSEYSRHLSAGTGVDYSGSSYSDPRRIALYFLGHSSKTHDGKEGQHIVPELWQAPGKGPGRFWGCPGFTKALVSLHITIDDFYRLARQLRKLRRSRDWVTGLKRMNGYADRMNVDRMSAVDIRWRKDRSESLAATGKLRGGWVLFNDALSVTLQLSEWLKSTR
jgi:hypothetical protein